MRTSISRERTRRTYPDYLIADTHHKDPLVKPKTRKVSLFRDNSVFASTAFSDVVHRRGISQNSTITWKIELY